MGKSKAKKTAVKLVKVRITEELQETTERWAERIVRVPSDWDSERIEEEVSQLFYDQRYETAWDWDDVDCDEIDNETRVELYEAPPTSDEVSEAGEDIWDLTTPPSR